ncbi:thermonuclease family protein [Psychromarinibacter sp. C21-152]|uniref:Thermonuclease family protein n=1 Tax=Psychromarinibacter sediminicola TaxID=3033385 RepID=A0AAE3TAL7_9RHOB|nr:thermonuclease family protein [Psychromarinibacter sediminicola]MDF0603875.1 thermonuclease family protein [Psychromarinibacter sediminicola]
MNIDDKASHTPPKHGGRHMKHALFAIAILAAPAQAIEMCDSGPRDTCVVDGDTFWYEGEKIRMQGYDTPEPQTNLCGGERERSLADRASERLLQLLNSGQISIERTGEDQYGRTVAVVRRDGVDVGDILISEGLARRWPDGCEFWCQPCN